MCVCVFVSVLLSFREYLCVFLGGFVHMSLSVCVCVCRSTSSVVVVVCVVIQVEFSSSVRRPLVVSWWLWAATDDDFEVSMDWNPFRGAIIPSETTSLTMGCPGQPATLSHFTSAWGPPSRSVGTVHCFARPLREVLPVSQSLPVCVYRCRYNVVSVIQCISVRVCIYIYICMYVCACL